MAELEVILTCLPNTVLEQFWDEAHSSTFHSMQTNVLQPFPTNFTTKHPQSLSDTAWVDPDDLKEWLRPNDSCCGFHPMPMNVPPVRMDANFGNAMFGPYHPVNFYVFEPTLGILQASVTLVESHQGGE
ncbi:hypothetical protein DFH08DRAFT_809984 [Mycena albidolilacea]|uniref:Uncharacterized protein n=1 Tax=Mycena albidolilacea TaxID=1033008 RepID=A0AAD6ZYN5_9AGAR|nr:hypothetical protein DFH08DRAFT_809984 [Mycena albidolilacea]